MSLTATATGGCAVLFRVPYAWYVKLRDDPANDGVKMTYCNGTLEIVSPTLFEHERWSRRLDKIILAVTHGLKIPCEGTGSTTFRRGGAALRKGHGKEPDQGYYLSHAALVSGKATIDLEAGDPPPDLWIEVDHRVSSRGRLPVYAAFGVPEVWRFRAKQHTLTFLGLLEDKRYAEIERSRSLPMLTPGLVLEALALDEGAMESEWFQRVQDWVRQRFETL